ncbi:MAG: LicD family protein [Rikenellaceae bacterium]|nr:LicD family protein [Rikenellaceae bacterium]
MIDYQLQQQLRERFNPEGSMLRKQQLRMLEILLYIDKICKENNIKYWLSSGTLLGAVRHGGFIPWDDDLDIEMLREDYEKFLKVFTDNDNYALQTYKSDENYFRTFAKVRDLHSEISEFELDRYYKYRGLYVDIFSIERVPKYICRLYGGVFEVIGRWRRKCGDNKFLWHILKCFQKITLWTIPIARPIFRIFTKDLHHSYGSGFLKERHIEDIHPLTRVQFEGYTFPAPNNVDSYLRLIYGDYNRLPDIDSFVIHTSSCIFK